jgi:phosphate uptake regulator
MNDKPMALDAIEAEMVELRKNGDLKVAHSLADELLGELIRTLALRSKNKEQARRIWNAYCDIDKWYA